MFNLVGLIVGILAAFFMLWAAVQSVEAAPVAPKDDPIHMPDAGPEDSDAGY